MVIWPNSTAMVPGWSPTKIVQMVLIGCICRSQGQRVGFQNAFFKNLVWNYEAQSFQIWYIASSRSSLPIFCYNNIMDSPWPLTFSSGERPRTLWALLLHLNRVDFYNQLPKHIHIYVLIKIKGKFFFIFLLPLNMYIVQTVKSCLKIEIMIDGKKRPSNLCRMATSLML